MNQPEFEPNCELSPPILGCDGITPELPEGNGNSLSLRVLLYIVRGLRVGSLEIHLPNGKKQTLTGTLPGDHGVLYIRDSRLVGHLLRGGEVGMGDAYLEGCWDSPDLTTLLGVLYQNEPYYRLYEKNLLGRFWGWLQHRRRANHREGSRANIEHHYDLGNTFYQLWLDDTMAYSSAVFSHPAETLRDAQLNKFRLMLERLDLRADHHLLEIGSGWGGFAIYAAQKTGCRVTSITLSREQLDEARLRAQTAGLTDRIDFQLCDYRDILGQYDRVVSIEMYEAVGEKFWPDYFAAIHKALAPGGRAAIQGITIAPEIFDQYRTKRDFIQKYIFPGGMLCPPELFQQLATKQGLVANDARFYARDYADTLAHWHRNVLATREDIVQQFDARFLRMWRYYLAYCECGFRTGSIDLMQVTLHKA